MNISVVIPAYNSETTILRALKSVLVQTSLPAEIIVVDDASSDGTLKLLHQLIKQEPKDIPIIVLENEKNCGPALARNKGIKAATGDWIAFLDADDYWHPQKLEIQSQVAKQNQAFLIGTRSTSENGAHKTFLPSDTKFRLLQPSHFLWKNYFQTPSVLVKKNELLHFNESMKYAEDFELWTRLIRQYQKAVYIDLPLTVLGKAPFIKSGLSSQLIKMELGELKVLWQEKNIFLRIVSALFSLLKFVRRIILKLVKS